MALATRCPNCHALFRVAAEQLRTRSGMVRCGACRKVFNAIAGLDYLDAQRFATGDAGSGTVPAPPAAPIKPPAPAPTSPPPSSARVSSDAARSAIDDAAKPTASPSPTAPARQREFTPAAEPWTGPPPTAAVPAPVKSAGPGTAANTAEGSAAGESGAGDRRRNPRPDSGVAAPNMTPAIGAGAADAAFRIAQRAEESTEIDAGGAALDTLLMGPADEASDDDGTPGSARFEDADYEPAGSEAEPGPRFLQETRSGPLTQGLLIAASALLIPLLVAQLALIFRTPLVVTLPALRPALQALCAPLACTASWPMRPDLLAVVSSELQAIPGTSVLELDTVLRNRAAFALALPAIELTISDNNGRTLARKVFLPGEYLDPSTDAGANPAAGNLAAGGDLAVRVYFDLPGISATNFEAYPFYP